MAKQTTIDDLAGMVQKGFLSMDRKFEQVDKKFEQVNQHFDKVETTLSRMSAQLSTLENDVADIKRDMISRNEFEDLMGRVKYLELKLGIESGK